MCGRQTTTLSHAKEQSSYLYKYNIDKDFVQVSNFILKLKEVFFIMQILITGTFSILLLGIYASLGFIGFMFIQLISYRVFKFNIYKKLMKVLEV